MLSAVAFAPVTRAPLALVLLTLAGAGCRDPKTRVLLADGSCGTKAAGEMRVRVLHLTGEGLSPSTLVLGAEGRLNETSLVIPPGARRRLELRVYDGDPNSTGHLVALGRTPYFDAAASEPAMQRLVVRPVDAFVPLCGAADAPLALTSPRAGHTATALGDGRIFIAGGYLLSGTGQTLTSSSSELVDPAAGTIAPSVSLLLRGPTGAEVTSARAFHGAALLEGQVLLAGGEVASPTGQVSPVSTGLAVNVEAGSVSGFSLQFLRTRGAAVLSDGRLLLVGGSQGTAPTPEPEQLRADLSGGRLSLSLARAGAAAFALGTEGLVVVAGGDDSQRVRSEVLVLTPQADRYTLAPAGSLQKARVEAVMAALDDAQHVLVLGGRSSTVARPLRAVDQSELLVADGATVTVSAGPFTHARSGGCAVTLEDGRVLWIGGREVGAAPDAVVSSDAVERFALQADGKVTVEALASLSPGRDELACVRLPDGAVLVTGGLSQTSAKTEVLAETSVLMPALP